MIFSFRKSDSVFEYHEGHGFFSMEVTDTDDVKELAIEV